MSTDTYEPEARTSTAQSGKKAGTDRKLVGEFDAAWDRGLEARLDYSFIKTYKPVMDDSAFRAWATTAEYRRWCNDNVPQWLGYGSN